MGLFKKKKELKTVTIIQQLNEEISKKQLEIENYNKIKANIKKFVIKYKSALTSDANVYSGYVTIYLKDKYYDKYPDNFFLYAEELGLILEPQCSGVYSHSLTRGVEVRAK